MGITPAGMPVHLAEWFQLYGRACRRHLMVAVQPGDSHSLPPQRQETVSANQEHKFTADTHDVRETITCMLEPA